MLWGSGSIESFQFYLMGFGEYMHLSCGSGFAAETYNMTDQEYLKADHNQHRDAGSTASTAVLVGDRLLVANVGDSRAVLCTGGKGNRATSHELCAIP